MSTVNNNTAATTTTTTLPKMTVPKKYMTASMPTRGLYNSEKALYHHIDNENGYYFNSNSTDENLLISQPLPDTVKIVREKPNMAKKDSYWLGCLIACLLCCAVKNERS